jgi:hypothetical protein
MDREKEMKMRRTRWQTRAVLAAALSMLAGAAGAQQPAATPDVAVEPDAIAALKSMGAYLRSLKQFQVDAATTDEDVLDDGQKIQTSGQTRILAVVPGRLFADVKTDRHDRIYLYDGKTFTLFARRAGLYASIPAPPTIGELSRMLDDQYDFSVPLEDLFFWGTPDWKADDITGAIDVGPSAVEDTTCQQYAFRQKDVDFQLWIQKGSNPLPRKIVITTRTDEARPQHTAVYTWNLAPSFDDQTFVFAPPPGVGKAVFPKPIQ